MLTDWAFQLLGIYSMNILVHMSRYINTRPFIEALFVIVKDWILPTCLSTERETVR